MRISLPLLALTVVALLGAALWPQPDHAVLLAFPPGVSAAPVFGLEEWRVLRLAGAGPLTLALLAPAAPGADPHRLRRETGAALATLAARRAGCAPAHRPDRSTP